MSKLALGDWAAVAEIAGAVAIVVSLIFVGFEIRQNTAEIRDVKSRELNTMDMTAQAQLANSSELAAIMVKAVKAPDELTDEERVRYNAWIVMNIKIWEEAFDAYNGGRIEAEDWEAWNDALALWFLPYYGSAWDQVAPFFGKDLQQQIEIAVTSKLSEAEASP